MKETQYFLRGNLLGLNRKKKTTTPRDFKFSTMFQAISYNYIKQINKTRPTSLSLSPSLTSHKASLFTPRLPQVQLQQFSQNSLFQIARVHSNSLHFYRSTNSSLDEHKTLRIMKLQIILLVKRNITLHDKNFKNRLQICIQDIT